MRETRRRKSPAATGLNAKIHNDYFSSAEGAAPSLAARCGCWLVSLLGDTVAIMVGAGLVVLAWGWLHG